MSVYAGLLSGSSATIGGNVGIGTASPSVRFHVVGSSILANNTSIDPDSYTNTVIAGNIADSGWGVTSGIGGNAGTGDSWAIGHNGSALFMGMQNGSAADTMQTYMRFDPNRNVYLVETSGNVGVGTTSPGAKLHIQGNVSASSYTGSLLSTNGVVSSSGQVDHNTTLNYDPNRHIDHTAVSISSGTGLTGGGTIAATRTLALTGQALSFHNLATNGLVTRTAADTIVARSIAVSGTGLSVSNADGVSGNPTITIGNGIISGSSASSPSQGTVRVTINGVDTDVDTGLQTGDSPSFVRLTSTQATGTAPFTVASTTVVSNLNADLLDGQHGSYYLTATSYAAGVTVSDTRNVTTTPETINMGVVFDFKANTSNALSDGGTYHGLMTFRQYGSTTDWSGGRSHQLGFTDNDNVWHRSGTSTSWGTWYNIIHTGQSGTVTNTMLAGSIANNKLANSTISGVSLGSNLNTLTISSPLSGTSYNGSAAVTIALATAYGDTQNPYASKTANYFLAAPNGSAGAPSFRAIVAADIPTLNQNTTGTASNITAYTINQNVGTANSPSFVTITSTQATGTAPFTVASTTVVTNLNADLLDGQHGSYYNSANNLSGTIPSAVLGNSTVYVGTTGIALNRASAAQTLTGVSIDGNAAGITGYSGTYWTSNNDGVSSGLDADLLDGQHGSYYTTAGNLSGTIPSAVLGNSTVYIGTTAIALNRGSASQTLTGISIDGNAATVSTVAALGTGINYNTDRTVKVTNGVAVYSGYSAGTNRPTTYDVAAQFIVNGAMGFEIVADWIGTTDTPLYVRSLRDCCQNWSSWSRILTDDYNPASSLSGTIPSAVLGNSTVYIGTTAIALNRGSAGQTLTGVSIDGNAATVSSLTAVQFFNNMGQNHSTRTSFDSSTPSYDFGFRYVQGSTNGPGTSGTQFYSWYIGLGNDYPSTGAGSYGAMFAVDRNVSNPYLSVRYNEGNSFGTWRKIYAGYADTAGTAGNITAYTINQNLGTSNSPTFAGLTVDTNTLYVDAGNDRVGIGTTSPSSKLHVNGDISIATDSAIRKSGDNSIIAYSSALPGIAVGSGTATDLLVLNAGGSEKIRINTSGNVGIGTTSPAGKLSISGGTETHSTAKVIGMTGTGASNDNQYNWAITAESDVNWGFRVSNKASGQYYTDILGGFSDGNNRGFRVINKNNATETVFMFINSSGNVGINTTSPSYKLDVNGGVRLADGGSRPTVIETGGMIYSQGDTGGWAMGHHVKGSSGTDRGGFGFYGGVNALTYYYVGQDYASPTMVIQSGSSGNVGIATTSPGRKLDVVGRLRFRSDGSVSSGVWHADSSGNEDIFVGQQGTAYTDSWGVYSNGSWRLVVARADGEIYLNSKSAFATADSYLRINQSAAFSAGIWFGSSNIAQGSTVYTSFGSNGGTTSSRIYIYGGTYDGNNVIYLDGSNGVIKATNIYINGLTYSWPSGHGGSGYVLANNGSGTLSWTATSNIITGGTAALTILRASMFGGF